MFRKEYVGYHGFSTFVRGVLIENDLGETAVRVTSVGREDDEIVAGDILTPEEIDGITEGDLYGYEEYSTAGLLV